MLCKLKSEIVSVLENYKDFRRPVLDCFLKIDVETSTLQSQESSRTACARSRAVEYSKEIIEGAIKILILSQVSRKHHGAGNMRK